MMTRRVSWTLWVLLSMVAAAQAAPRDADPAPDADFLEFLGSWHTGDDRWVDPFHAAELSRSETGDVQKDSRRSSSQEPPRINRRESPGELDRKGNRPADPPREMTP